MIPVKAYMQLIKIASIEGVTKTSGIEAREEALKEWLKSWVEEVEDKQGTVGEVNLTQSDEIKYYLARHLTEQLMQDCVIIEEQPKKIVTKIAAFRRREK